MTSIRSLFAKMLSLMMMKSSARATKNIKEKLRLIVSFKQLHYSPTQMEDLLKSAKLV